MSGRRRSWQLTSEQGPRRDSVTPVYIRRHEQGRFNPVSISAFYYLFIFLKEPESRDSTCHVPSSRLNK